MEKKKQVIYLMTDATRADMLGCYGHNGMITPNLDRLAGEGIRFDRAYTCPSSVRAGKGGAFYGDLSAFLLQLYEQLSAWG